MVFGLYLFELSHRLNCAIFCKCISLNTIGKSSLNLFLFSSLSGTCQALSVWLHLASSSFFMRAIQSAFFSKYTAMRFSPLCFISFASQFITIQITKIISIKKRDRFNNPSRLHQSIIIANLFTKG